MNLERIERNSFLVIGRAGMDLYADPPGAEIEGASRFFACLGGSSGNIAAGIARLGGKASIVTVVSDDAVGRFTVKELRGYGVDTSHVRSVGGEFRNSLAVVETRLENCQSVIYRNGAADFEMTEDDLRGLPFADYGAMILTGTALAAEPSRGAAFSAMERARRAGLPVILDVDYRPYSWSSGTEAAEVYGKAALSSDIVVGNDDEFAVMAGGPEKGLDRARELAAGGSRVVVYKMGERGAVTFTGAGSFETGIFPVEALKPTGAGDAFLAGFAASLAAGKSLEVSVRRGAAAAAIVVSRVGCAPAMPTPDALEAFLSEHHEHPA